MKKISIVVPFYNESASLPTFLQAVTAVTSKQTNYEFDFVFVNDGSQDDGVDILKGLMTTYPNVVIVDLSRNFGKEVAMLAGLDHSQGDATIIMDSDLQHPPAVIPEFIKYWEEGYYDVYAVRREREGESWLKIKTSELYYKILQSVSSTDVYPNAGDFRLLDRRVVEALVQTRESERYMKGLYGWVGFKKKEIYYDAAERINGETKFNFGKLWRLALNGITSFTTAPLTISIYVGLIVAMVGIFYGLYVLVTSLLGAPSVPGFPSLMVAILILGGLQLFVIGLIGLYLSRVFIETKRRPVYFVNEVYRQQEQ
ncbi:glycosyltransferase family 2 protein [Weissella confusa]|uniref:glycosyltransferase family 2 protein n=1 Tax=Weissella confusa TaxID=1583 RepID=UPI00223BC97F|nr:glycosyltransferase family 2 protein [Weissella confusa]MCT0043032.1 glycosyltransferase [Weissella confusa]MDA5457448.1 Dolichol-phosphate mannosyltransferase MtrA [Weissella confusa]MDA5459462.1 Dolichol-phosphate mannosyltransferase MtrA [Weissella confusa]